jgi:AcrR family transcriptional regulator
MAPRTETQNEELRAKRRNELLQAARRVFARKGFHAANVADVAAEARVSQGTVYHYFDSKEELLMAVFEAWEMDHLQQELKRSLEAEPTAAGRLTLVAHAAAQRLGTASDLLSAQVEFWSHIPRHAAIRKGFRRLFAQVAAEVAQIIQHGIESGEFRSVDANMLARLVIATYDGLLLQWLADKKAIDWQSSVNTLTTVMLQGLLMRNAGTTR